MPFLPRADPFARRMIQGAIGFAAVMLVMFAVFTAVYMHVNPKCSEETISYSVSPGGNWVATLMVRRCGESVAPVTHLNLRPVNQPLALGYFTGTATDGQVFAVSIDSQEAGIEMQWNGDSNLKIACAGCGSYAGAERVGVWQSVRLEYLEVRQ